MKTRRVPLTLAAVLAINMPPQTNACTIFVLTDATHALFCNNEDWSNPKTRIWFVPAGTNRLGCVYVGFDNGWAQGGMNTEGLAFDWVAGFKEQWARSPGMIPVHGNPSERMLQTCTTIDEVAQFYRRHYEPSFSYGKILVADRTGASAIIGSTGGKLTIEESRTCRGFGYARRVLDQKLAATPEVSVASGGAILRACLQDGEYATKYSSIFNNKNGDIFLFRFPEQADPVKLNLKEELRKGGHYYDIPELRAQLSQPVQPLLDNMQRAYLNDFKPIPDKEPEVTQRIRAAIADAVGGKMRAEDYTTELWNEIKPQALQPQLVELGPFESLTLVERSSDDGRPSYRYRVELQNATLLQHYALDEQQKVARIQSEDMEWRSVGADASVASGLPPKVHNRQVASFTEGSRAGLRFDERSGDGVAWWPGTFTNGIIEFDVRGKDVLQKSFVGLAFHGVDEKTYDAVYFRPFNFRATDPARRNHAVQYVSLPTHDWQKLRAEHPEKYEKPVAPAPDPNQWFHARIVVAHPKVSVFVNDATAPCLVVQQLSDRKSGWVGFWVGNGSGGEFADLKISALKQIPEGRKP